MQQLIEDALTGLTSGDVKSLAQRLALGRLQSVEDMLPLPLPRHRRGGGRDAAMW